MPTQQTNKCIFYSDIFPFNNRLISNNENQSLSSKYYIEPTALLWQHVFKCDLCQLWKRRKNRNEPEIAEGTRSILFPFISLVFFSSRRTEYKVWIPAESRLIAWPINYLKLLSSQVRAQCEDDNRRFANERKYRNLSYDQIWWQIKQYSSYNHLNNISYIEIPIH